jgi:DNA-binding XRE family transcriptional regulator
MAVALSQTNLSRSNPRRIFSDLAFLAISGCSSGCFALQIIHPKGLTNSAFLPIAKFENLYCLIYKAFYGIYTYLPYIISIMLPLVTIAEEIIKKRKAMGLSQTALAKKAHISRSTLDALENGRIGELGYTKISNLLAVLGLELKIQEAVARRPTLEELLNEDRDD